METKASETTSWSYDFDSMSWQENPGLWGFMIPCGEKKATWWTNATARVLVLMLGADIRNWVTHNIGSTTQLWILRSWPHLLLFLSISGFFLAKVKRRVRSHLARWEMKNCTPSWREADLEVKKLKTPHAWNIFGQLRCGKSAQRCGAKCEALFVVKMQKKHVQTTFGSWDVEKVHAVVARSTFWSQHVEKHGSVGVLLEEWRKKCTLLWHEAYLEVKCLIVQTAFGSWDVEKAHAVVAGSTFWSQTCWKHDSVGALLEEECCNKCTPLARSRFWS